MPVRIVCPSCSAALSVKDELAGRALKCPKCGGTIPASQTSGSGTSPPPAPRPAFEEVNESTKPKTGSKVTGLPAPRVKAEEDEQPAKAKTGSKVTGVPATRVKKDDDDEEDEDRPRRKKRDEDEDDEDRPRRKKRDEEEDEDRPRRKKRDEDEDDEDRPRRKKRDEDEDDEDDRGAKSKKKGEDEEDEEDEDRPTKKRKKQDDEDEDEDEDDDRPRGKKKKQKGGAKMGIIIGLVAGVLLLCCGGGGITGYFLIFGSSNNSGKIVGKWKITGGPGMDVKQMESMGMSMIMEFKDDGTVAMYPQFSDPKMQKLVEASGEKTSFSWKYKLGSGDEVEFYDFPKELKGKKSDGPFGSKDRANAKVKIDGDSMTINDEETMKTTPLKLTKVK